MSKICVIYHSVDLDGWMSAAIVRHWFEKSNDTLPTMQNVGTDNFIVYQFQKSSLTMIGYNYGEPIPDLSGYDKVIMCDISFPKEEMNNLEFMLEYGNPESENFIWIDHHISAMNDNSERNFHGLRDTKFAACELTWKYFFLDEEMPEIVRLLGRYDCFGHKGTPEEKKVLEFQYGARQVISNYEDAYYYLTNIFDIENKPLLSQVYENGKVIYKHLYTEAKQTYNNGFEIELKEDIDIISESGIGTQPTIFNPPQKGKIVHKFICINKERFNPINFGIDYHSEGYDGVACFWYEGKSKLWKFSLYNDNGQVDCSAIAQQFGGGGHKGASGFIVDDIEKFLNKYKV